MELSQDFSEQELVESAMGALRRRLPATWSVEQSSSRIGDEPEVLHLTIKVPSNQTNMILAVRSQVTARDVQVLFGGPWKGWRKQMSNQPILLIAPYVGPTVRKLLVDLDVSYLDLTGNIRIALDYPGIFIEAQGAERDPTATKARRGLRGAKVGAVVRALVDARPPYTGAEIAKAAKANEGYVSRILDALVDEGLIDRERAGPITSADWPGLIRRRAQALDLFRSAGVSLFIARQGARQLLQRMKSEQLDAKPTITGSFAAARIAPVAGSAMLVLYTMKPRELAEVLELLPTQVGAGADTVLIRPDNEVVFERAKEEEGLRWASPSQVAIDCLAGNGRMPAEGEALIEWMSKNESEWRFSSIRALIDASKHKANRD